MHHKLILPNTSDHFNFSFPPEVIAVNYRGMSPPLTCALLLCLQKPHSCRDFSQRMKIATRIENIVTAIQFQYIYWNDRQQWCLTEIEP